MKNINFILFFSVILFSMVSCKVDELPGTKNQAVTSGGLKVENDDASTVVNGRSVSLKAIINNEQSREITECGVLYSTVQGFSQGQAEKVVASAENITENSFTVNIDNLVDDKTYYYYFYVNHSGGLSMSGESSFEVPAIEDVPLVVFDENKVIDGTTLYGVVLSNGHKELIEYGVQWSTTENMTNPQKVQGVQTEIVDGALYYSVDLSTIIDAWNSAGELYFQMYAVNELGKGTSEVKKMPHPKIYAKYEVTRLWVTDATTAKMEIKCVATGENLTSYGYVINGTMVELNNGTMAVGATEVIEMTGLNDGDNKVYIYGVNKDGTSVETSENSRIFSTKILDKYDPTIRYFELDPIKVENADEGTVTYYYFLDRNLGAKEAAETTDTAPRTDAKQDEAGWLFQWGRDGQGHQYWDSEVENEAGPLTSESQFNNHKTKFMAHSRYTWFDNSESQKDKLYEFWNREWNNGGNYNPCPSGYYVPSSADLILFFDNKDRMKIVVADKFRTASKGLLSAGTCYWTSQLVTSSGRMLAYAWVIESNSGTLKWPTSGSPKELGQGNFIRPVRVDVLKINK